MSSPLNQRTGAVIGGGPAGLIAAETLARAGVRVTVFEHMASVGRKFLLAGRSGLNLTHVGSYADLLAQYGQSAQRLRVALADFGPDELCAWCEGLGEPTFVGSTGRVFPTSWRATPLLRAWLARLDALGVTFAVRHRWLGLDGPGRSRFRGPAGAEVTVDHDVAVLALGGASWPRVGADGGWVPVLEALGVRVVPLRPANCGLVIPWSHEFATRFPGTPLKNIALHVDGRRVRGDLMITNDGIEGGPVYTVASTVRDTIERAGTCVVEVDLQPDRTRAQISERLMSRRPKESTSTLLKRTLGLSSVAIGVVREATGNTLPTTATAMADLVAAVPLRIVATAALDRAISTAGGIDLDEIDATFQLRRVPGLFVAGEMLDWDAPTGGYLLQASFSTGVAAARGAVAHLS